MQSLDFKAKNYIEELDEILQKSLESLETGKDDIFKISEMAREEYDRIEKELEDLKQELTEVIAEVDKLSKTEKSARLRLIQVSKNFRDYNEEDIKNAYEKASCMQVELILKREEEKQLRVKRDELERTLKTIDVTLKRAENLALRLSTVIDYLKSDLNILTQQLKDIHEKQVVGMRIIQAQEQERKRIARDIHDGPAQVLANIIIMAEICEKMIEKNEIDEAKQELNELKGTVRTVLKEIRKTIYDLRPMALDDLGLVPAIKKYVNLLNKEGREQVRFIIIGEEEALPRYLDTTLFRIIQEGVANIRKHASANNIDIKLEMRRDYINLSIEDDGTGFNVRRTMTNEDDINGLGLMGIKERAKLVDGEAAIESRPGHGTRIFVKIPIYERGRS